jgi:hypothetical protein
VRGGGREKIKFKIAGKALGRLQERADRPQDSVDNVTSRLGSIFESERFAPTTQEINLDNDWRKYEVDVRDGDPRGITLRFGYELSKGASRPAPRSRSFTSRA